MFGIATAGGHRGQTNLDWRFKALIFSVAASVGGAVTGGSLGWLSATIPERSRVTIASVAAVVLGGIALWHLSGERARMLERDCETAQRWLELGPARWALLNGAALGSGFLSRIGVVSYYALPVACVGFGDPVLGAVVFGTYGIARGFAVWPWLAALRFGDGIAHDTLAESLFRRHTLAKRVGAFVLLVISTVTVVIAGV
jgi:hypothetical protein